jgi:hypothetical protein
MAKRRGRTARPDREARGPDYIRVIQPFSSVIDSKWERYNPPDRFNNYREWTHIDMGKNTRLPPFSKTVRVEAEILDSRRDEFAPAMHRWIEECRIEPATRR